MESADPKQPADLIERYRIDSAERESIVFTADDDAFLRAGAAQA
jgi:hypothetical protein